MYCISVIRNKVCVVINTPFFKSINRLSIYYEPSKVYLLYLLYFSGISAIKNFYIDFLIMTCFSSKYNLCTLLETYDKGRSHWKWLFLNFHFWYSSNYLIETYISHYSLFWIIQPNYPFLIIHKTFQWYWHYFRT